MESLHLKYSGTEEDYPYLEFINTGTGANAGSIIFKKNSSDNSPADNDKLGKIIFQGTDFTNNTLENFSEIVFSSTDVTSGSEDSKIQFKTFADGTLNNTFLISSDKVGIGSNDPGTLLQVEGTEPYITLKNTSSENTDGGDSGNSYTGCESRIIFEDHANNELARLQGNHDGTNDDTKGDLIFFTNNGTAITEGFRLNSSGNVGIGQTAPTHKLDVTGTTRFVGNSTITGDVTITGDTTIGGFLKPRLDLIFDGYTASGSNTGTINYTDEYCYIIQTIPSLEGSLLLPANLSDANTTSDDASTLALRNLWGNTNKNYLNVYNISSSGNVTLSGSLSSGLNFFGIIGEKSQSSAFTRTYTLPTPSDNSHVIVVAVNIRLTSPGGNYMRVQFNCPSAVDDNSISILANTPEVATKAATGNTYFLIEKRYSNTTSTGESTSNVSGYIMFRPNSSGQYHVISALAAYSPMNVPGGYWDDILSTKFL